MKTTIMKGAATAVPKKKSARAALLATLTLLLCAPLTLCLGGCLHIDTPRGFVELDDAQSYRYRATSATGVVLAVRSEDSRKDEGGDLDFWSEAINRRVRRLGGYALLETRDVKTARGMPGKQLRFGHDRNSRPHLYWVSLFIDGDDLYVVEAGGPKEAFGELEAGLEKAIASIR